MAYENRVRQENILEILPDSILILTIILTRAQAILALIKLLFKALIPLGQFHPCSLCY